ncbi:MAG: group II intron reverse transcriptase/maturase [Bacteroidetes bacterium]|nr:MAG: group II intron reverse transcriptase/maturase [Bacteroidota bacterium]
MSVSNQLWTSADLVPSGDNLLEQIVDRLNMIKACKRVVANKGNPGVDKMSIKELPGWLQRNHDRLAKSLLEGSYRPKPVRLAEIDKPGGGKRGLGIPTVIDRMIQQAIHQVLNPLFDPGFSDSSFGYRKGKSAEQAVLQAQRYQQEGKRWVVDVDLSRFFDQVNHDVLMAKIKRKVKDKRVLKLLDYYLRTGIMQGGVASPRTKGTPQGSPLSPLLSNILLNELDTELEKRGHSSCRYADDFVIFVRSEKAAQRVFDTVTSFIEKRLKLEINKSKSRITRGHRLTFLGYGFMGGDQVRLKVPKEIQKRFRMKAKILFRKGRGMNLRRFITEHLNPFLRGWFNYYKHCKVKTTAEELDAWIRRRLRLILWRQWKKPRTRFKRFISFGLDYDHAMQCAFNGRDAWWNSGAQHMNFAFPKKFFANLGLVSLLSMVVYR